jgi:hypothetical protein
VTAAAEYKADLIGLQIFLFASGAFGGQLYT